MMNIIYEFLKHYVPHTSGNFGRTCWTFTNFLCYPFVARDVSYFRGVYNTVARSVYLAHTSVMHYNNRPMYFCACIIHHHIIYLQGGQKGNVMTATQSVM